METKRKMMNFLSTTTFFWHEKSTKNQLNLQHYFHLKKKINEHVPFLYIKNYLAKTYYFQLISMNPTKTYYKTQLGLRSCSP